VASYLNATETFHKKSLGRITNISSHGMALRSIIPIRFDHTYSVKINIPSNSHSHRELAFDIEPVWITKDKKTGFYDFGVEMLNISEENIRFIESFVMNFRASDQWITFEQNTPQEY
jgi:c-di-GMP-binding flagellar brake protein YcgR